MRTWCGSSRAGDSTFNGAGEATSPLKPDEGDAPRALERTGSERDVVSTFQSGPGSSGTSGKEGDGSREDRPATGCSVVVCTYLRPRPLVRCLESLMSQASRPDEILIVDASPDAGSEDLLRTERALFEGTVRLRYFRVSEKMRGLTRQRNFALRHVAFDLVAFFDDDVALEPSCLAQMEQAHRLLGDRVVGVGAMISDEAREPTLLWRVRRWLRIVGDLKPGTYARSGMSIPWFAAGVRGLQEGDWLPGCGMMWKTAAAREVGFHEGFAGYAQGEDLEFCLRAGRHGSLVMASEARLRHLHEGSGRPDHFKLGYMTIHNRYEIHRRGLAARSWRDVTWFVYAWTLDSLMFCRHLLFPGRWASTFRHLGGRLAAAADLSRGR